MATSKQRHPRPRRSVSWAIGIILLLAMSFVGANVWNAARIAATFPQFWRAKASEPSPPDAVHLVAFGDSATQAIGADRPMDGFVGRIATYVRARTGRPVHITNVSVGGATYADVVRQQLPLVDLRTADIVVVASSNDLEKRMPLDTYRAALETLMRTLPPDKTVVSDLPLEPGREPYQAILQERADAHHLLRADFARIFDREGRRLDIFSWLFPHLNSKGYAYWFLAFQPAIDTILRRINTPGR